MNNLSWLIYLADALNAARWVFGLFALVAIFATICAWICAYTEQAEGEGEKRVWDDVERRHHYTWTVTPQEATRRARAQFRRPAVTLTCFATLFTFGFIAFPSSNTMYAIAASEVGEDVLNSPTGSKAVKALDAWLDRQIAPPEGGQ